MLSVLGYGAPKIIRGEVVERFILACKQSASHGGIRDDGDTKLSCGLEQGYLFILDIQGKRRIFDLEGGDWVNGVGATKGSSRALGQSYIFHLSRSEHTHTPAKFIPEVI